MALEWSVRAARNTVVRERTMHDLDEKLWTYDAVQTGQQGHPTVVTLTSENIAA